MSTFSRQAHNADEGFYLFASRLVSDGLLPFRDFGYTQGPLWPYVEVPWLDVFGFSLEGIRLSSVVWTFACLVLGVFSLRKKDPTWMLAAVFLVLLAGAPSWLAFSVKGKTYAFAGLMVLMGAIAVDSRWSTMARWALFLLAAAFGCGCRYPMAGFFIPAWIGLLVTTQGRWAKVVAILVSFGTGAGVLLPFIKGHGDVFFFWTAGFHLQSTFRFLIWRHFEDCFLFAPALWLGGLYWFCMGLSAPGGVGRWLIGSLLLAVVVNLSGHSGYAEYAIPFLPALAWCVVPAMKEIFSRLSWGGAGLVMIGVLMLGWLSPPEIDANLLMQSREAEAFLRDHVTRDGRVVASMPEIAVAALRPISPLLAMGKFGLTEEFDEDRAAKLHMLTPGTLLALLHDSSTQALVFSTSFKWNFFWSLPSYRVISEGARRQIDDTIRNDYWLSFNNDSYVIFLRAKKETVTTTPAKATGAR